MWGNDLVGGEMWESLWRLAYFHLLDHGIYVAERGFMALALTLSDADFDALETALAGFIERYRGLLN